jgi:hypothetical protein
VIALSDIIQLINTTELAINIFDTMLHICAFMLYHLLHFEILFFREFLDQYDRFIRGLVSKLFELKWNRRHSSIYWLLINDAVCPKQGFSGIVVRPGELRPKSACFSGVISLLYPLIMNYAFMLDKTKPIGLPPLQRYDESVSGRAASQRFSRIQEKRQQGLHPISIQAQRLPLFLLYDF